MPTIGTPSFDQLRVLLAVAEAGSFSAAARKLNRRQSVISYTIANLEQQLGGLKLFDRTARRPVLTEAGRTILAEARKLSLGIDGLRARASGLVAGLEAELGVAIDVMLPSDRLICALVAFRAEFPTVTLRLYVEALGSVARLVLDRTCTIGASGPMSWIVDGLERRPIGKVRLVRVAAPGHPMAQRAGPISEAVAREHVQLVLTDRSDLTKGQDFGVVSPECWRLADLGAKHALLLAGLGWGGMPEAIVRDDIAAGRLRTIIVDGLPDFSYDLLAIHRTDTPPGPAGRWFMQRLAGNEAAADRHMDDLDDGPHRRDPEDARPAPSEDHAETSLARSAIRAFSRTPSRP